jgi:cyclic pyranopterin phosphate synthase
MKAFSHIDTRGEARMVDVSAKPVMKRQAIARAEILMQKSTLRRIKARTIAKGNVLAAAQLAGIMAAKKTGELIPLCHPLSLAHCEVRFEFPKTRDRIRIMASATVAAQTGVEMEALTAATVAALTLYDMCKAVDKAMQITGIKLVAKSKSDLTGNG